MEDGVWRTIAGRRVFIREGQSLSDAMRKSGKFTSGEVTSKRDIEREEKYKKEDEERDAKAKKQLTEEAKELMDDMKYLDKDEEGYEEALQEIKERYADLRRKEGNWQSRQSKEVGEALKQIEKEQSGASEQELKDELYHNVRMQQEMERRLSGRYKITEEERDKLERRATHYEATADDIREKLKEMKKEKIILDIEKAETQKDLLRLRTKGEQITGDPGTSNWDNKFAKKFDEAYQKKEREMVAAGKSKTMKEKYLDIPQRERAEAYAQGKNWKDLVKEKEGSSKKLQTRLKKRLKK